MDTFVAISSFRSLSYGSENTLYFFTVLSFILSLFLIIFGKRLLRLNLAIIGFISFGSIPFWICMTSYYPYIELHIILIIMAVVGVVAAFIVAYFTKFGIYIISAGSGVQLGYLLYELIYYNRYQQSMVLFIVLAILFGLAGLILTYYFMSYMVIVITTFNGFLLFRCGIQYMLFALTVGRFWEPYPIYSSGPYWGNFFGSLFVGCLGAFWQYHKYKNYPYLKNMESNQTPDEKC